MDERVAPERPDDVQRITDAALAHLDLDDLLRELLERIAEVLAVDTVAALLLDEDAGELVARAARGLEEEVERGVRIPVGRGFAGRVAAGRRPVVIEDVDHADVLNPLLRERGVKSLLGVPLIVEGSVIGVLHVGSLTPRRFTERESALLQLGADRAALALDHARLFEAERSARRDAETALRELSDVQSVTDAALGELNLDDLLRVLLERVAEMLDADTAAILLLDPERAELVARAAKGLEEEVERGLRIPVGRGFAGRVAAERRAVALDDVEHADVLNPLLRERGVKSLLGVPLLGDAGVVGVLHIGTLRHRRFSERDARLLQIVADRAAIAIERARVYEREHSIAETLQRSLLPDRLAELPGVDVAARYLAPAAAADVGGDWFDAIALPDGRIGVAIGDVVGRGLPAATLMGQLRNALRAYAIEGREPAAIAELLNRLTREAQPGATATMIYLVHTADTDSIDLVNAGHLPPLLVDPSGEATFVETTRAVPLGATRHTVYSEDSFEVGPGSTLLLYTDGLVERRDEDLAAGLERLRAVAAGEPTEAATRCDAVVDRLLVRRASADDVAVLAFRPLPIPDRLEHEFPAQPEVVPVMRRLLRRWLREQGVPDETGYDVLVAVAEACANAIEHAYGPIAEATFAVTAAVADGHVEVTVSDRGGWRDPRGQHRGRGLMLMEAFMDDVHVTRGEDGTTVVLRRRVAEEVAA
jgi:GAF domain-containing protein/anti-sigma regulatory factor (Ser/Thr protein kinase)